MIEEADRVRELSEKQLEDPSENSYTILAHTIEELGEFATAICIEDNSGVKGYKKLDESAKDEAIDVAICALSLYYSRGGKTEEISEIMNRKLDKWESKIPTEDAKVEVKTKPSYLSKCWTEFKKLVNGE